jgi:hypothetical protein
MNNDNFYLDERLIKALNENNIEKYLKIINDKYREGKYNSEYTLYLDNIIPDEYSILNISSEEISNNITYREKMLKTKEYIFFKILEEIKRKDEEELNKRIKARMINEEKILMMESIFGNINRLEHTIKSDQKRILEKLRLNN